ncbi:hypothetical protein QR685DRAFT_571522 [Neurospora intermedia]|uniref:Uncharacterized protein n=1 Tax=Neurospora intermedia TaxID=5142 RepID=A0ABR3DCJ7_NEUIN
MSTYYSGGAGNTGSGNGSKDAAVGPTSGAGDLPASTQAPKRREYGSMMNRYIHDTTTQVSDRVSGHQDPISNDRHRLEVLQRVERRRCEAERLARIARGN